MSNGIQIDFPTEDVRALFREMDRAQKQVGRSSNQSLKWAGWNLTRSLGAATKMPERDVVVSAKRRKVYEVDSDSRKPGRLKTYEYKVYGRSGARTKRLRAASKSEANRSERLKIKGWGTARASWMWAVKQLGSGARFATDRARSTAAKVVDVVFKRDDVDPMIKITNRLPWLMAAMPGGESALNQAAGKAARAMEKQITGKLDKEFSR